MNTVALAELDARFNAADSTMTVAEFGEQRALLMAEPAPAPEKEKRALAVVQGIAKLNDDLRDMGDQAAIQYLALEVANHRAVLAAHGEQHVSVDQLKRVIAKIASVIVERTQPLAKRVSKMEAGAHGGGVTIRSEHVTVDGMEHVAGMMERLDATLRSPVKPIYGPDGMLVGARRELPEDEPAARARKPRLKLRDGAFVMIDGYHR